MDHSYNFLHMGLIMGAEIAYTCKSERCIARWYTTANNRILDLSPNKTETQGYDEIDIIVIISEESGEMLYSGIQAHVSHGMQHPVWKDMQPYMQEYYKQAEDWEQRWVKKSDP